MILFWYVNLDGTAWGPAFVPQVSSPLPLHWYGRMWLIHRLPAQWQLEWHSRYATRGWMHPCAPMETRPRLECTGALLQPSLFACHLRAFQDHSASQYATSPQASFYQETWALRTLPMKALQYTFSTKHAGMRGSNLSDLSLAGLLAETSFWADLSCGGLSEQVPYLDLQKQYM